MEQVATDKNEHASNNQAALIFFSSFWEVLQRIQAVILQFAP